MKRWKQLLLGVAMGVLLSLGVSTTQVEAGLNVGTPATEADVVAATSTNKKGIQETDEMLADPDWANLSVDHVFFNLDLAYFLADPSEAGDDGVFAYEYNGKTYYFRKLLNVYQWRAEELRRQGKILTFAILLSDGMPSAGPTWAPSETAKKVKYAGANDGTLGHYYYALNTQDAESREILSAAFHCFAEVFGYKESFVQNWIIGNEVNMPGEYNYTGTTDKDTNVNAVFGAYELLYQALKDTNNPAKAYICLTHHWNNNNDGRGIASRDFLDSFAAKCAAKGYGWNLAYHAYDPNPKTAMFNLINKQFCSYFQDSRYVAGANLEVMTNYIKDTYGESHRIILSEQGFDSVYTYQDDTNHLTTQNSEDTQAFELAYVYNAAARNDMIDAAIFISWKDTSAAIMEGTKMGLLKEDGTKKKAYDVFKYMNTSQASAYIDQYLSVGGISAWTDPVLPENAGASAQITSASIYTEPMHYASTGNIYFQMQTTISETADLEYKWTVDGVIVQDWVQTTNTFLIYTPTDQGEHKIVGEVRTASRSSSKKVTIKFNAATLTSKTLSDANFEDVTSGWYVSYVTAAAEDGLMTGLKNADGTITKFGPEETLTRGMFATVLYRMAGSPAVEFENAFSDVTNAGAWYAPGVIWAYKNGIVKGYPDGTFGWEQNITREQICKMLYYYAKDVAGVDVVSGTADITTFPGYENVAGYAQVPYSWANGKGIVTGKKNNGNTYLDPKANATRAECATMLVRFKDKYGIK